MQPQGAMSAVKQTYTPGRRSRVPLSCDPCRTRKLKCNRQSPCQNCTARDEESACKYRGSKNGPTPMARQDARKDQMQQRIDHLEDLVKILIAQRQEIMPPKGTAVHPKPGIRFSVPAVASDASDVAYSTGTTVINGVHSVYRGADDWYDVLQEINNLKRVWNQTQDDETDFDNVHPPLSHTVDGSSLLLTQVKPIEKIEILATLPPKSETDKMICWFFDRETFPITVPPILHEPTFMREYNEHWKDPSRTNIIWLGLLFSILGITMLAYHRFGEPAEYEGISESLFQLYRMRTAQCLLIGDIAKCLPYTLETLRFNATAELNRKDDNRRGLWIMTGVIVRVAINMGYHRDPLQTSSSSSVSTLQAEYRRRVWLSVVSMDDMSSFLGGFPRMIPAIYSDTMEPRNLHDWELPDHDNITNLPPSRPLTEPTPVIYMIVKGRLFHALGRIADFNINPNWDYDTVLEIDKALYEAHQNIPPHMRVYTGGTNSKKSSKEDPKLNFSNLNLEFMYHKGMCTLHRKFITKGRLDPRFDLSRNRCISSALALIDLQHLLEPSWYQSARTRQLLSLAAMMLFLELELRRRGLTDRDESSSSSSSSSQTNSAALLQALEKSCALWANAKNSCDEAGRVYETLSEMLSSFRIIAASAHTTSTSTTSTSTTSTSTTSTSTTSTSTTSTSTTSTSTTSTSTTSTSTTSTSTTSDAAIGSSQTLITPRLPSSSSSSSSLEECPKLKSPPFQPIHSGGGFFWDKDFSVMPNDMEIDWTTWDSFIEGSNFEDGAIY